MKTIMIKEKIITVIQILIILTKIIINNYDNYFLINVQTLKKSSFWKLSKIIIFKEKIIEIND